VGSVQPAPPINSLASQSLHLGNRSNHTLIPGQEPLHSEAINAAVLKQLSDGRQLLRGNTVFGLDHTREIVLEVWHDSPHPVKVCSGELRVRELGDQSG
jgi:hypothetical protein